MDIFGYLIVLAFWFGFWLWFFTKDDESSLPRKGASPLPEKERDFSSDAM